MVHLGPNGSGALMKLINNFVCGVEAATFAEAMALVERQRARSRESVCPSWEIAPSPVHLSRG